MKKFFITLDRWSDKFMTAASKKPILEYFAKYLLACGIGANFAGLVFILVLILNN